MMIMRTALARSFKLKHSSRCFPRPSSSSGSRPRYQHSSAGRPVALRISHVLGGLVVFGIGATAWGLYDFYSAFTIWPEEVRADLRAGVKAKHQGELALSERFLRRAYQNAISLPLAVLSPEPYLKTTGIAITLAEVLETQGKIDEAYRVYGLALDFMKLAPLDSPATAVFAAALEKAGDDTDTKEPNEEKSQSQSEEDAERDSQPPLSGRERVRVISLALRLGEMAETYGRPAEEQKVWLEYAVKEALGIHLDEQLQQNLKGTVTDRTDAKNELVLPEWVTTTDLTAPMVALAEFIAQHDQPELAFPLYRFALQLLLKEKPEPSAEGQCRCAQILNNMAELTMRSPPPLSIDGNNPTAYLARAENDARLATKFARGGLAGGNTSLCEQVLPVALFNLGMIYERQDKRDLAKDHYRQAIAEAKEAGLKEGVLEAQAALRRINREKRPSRTT